jgi:hypothetical protein
LDEEPKKSGYIPTILIAILFVSLGIATTLLWGRPKTSNSIQTQLPDSKDQQAIKQEAQYIDVINFAERFTIMVFNVSYTDINHQEGKVANLMSDNMMSYYQDAFLDPKWIAFLADNKAYVTYQGIDRSTVENTDGTHYWVRVIGKCFYNSDARGPGSQIELPFHLVVVVKNDNGKLIVTDFQRL